MLKSYSKRVINPSTFSSLSTYQAVILQVLVLVVTLGYGTYHLLYDKKLIGFVAAFSAFFLVLSIWSIYRRKVNGYYFSAVIASQFVCLIVTSYFYGLRGLILVFPVSACAFYVLNYRLAFYSSLFLIIASLCAAFNVQDVVMLGRMSIALFLSISFSAGFSYVVTQQYKNLEYDANHDYLTGMMNRRGFGRWLKRSLSMCKANKTPLTLFYLDLDGFKSINDNFGHSCGDELLKAFSNRVLATLRSNKLMCERDDLCNFARLSADEFALAIEGISSVETVQKIATRIIDSAAEPFEISNTEVRISISIGLASAEVAEYEYSTLLNHANTAMYSEKQSGKNGYRYYDDEIAKQQIKEDEIETLIRTALDEDGFYMVYQPIYHCGSQQLKGAEALIRCPKAIEKGIYPDVFIPIAEKVGLIRRLDLWVIESVLKTIGTLPQGHEYKKLVYSINISALELHNSLFPNKLRQLFAEYSVDVKNIQLEITETSLIALDERCMSVLRELSSIGVMLALDDFGMGYTAFNQLRRYPVDTLKIDRSFIMDLDDRSEQATGMVELILSLASLYGLQVTAEGVETAEQLAFLKSTKCDFIQGYVLSRPIQWEEFKMLPKAALVHSNVTPISSVPSK